jgi:hypothetical protein
MANAVKYARYVLFVLSMANMRKYLSMKIFVFKRIRKQEITVQYFAENYKITAEARLER